MNHPPMVEQPNPVTSSVPTGAAPFAACIYEALDRYFIDLEGQPPSNLYQLVMNEVERPLLNAILTRTHGNQSKAAHMLGINRGTLRKKLIQHGLDVILG